MAEVNAYAREHGATVEFLPAEMSVSGGLPIEDRPSLLAAIEGVEAGRYTGIVVAYLSRLTRSRSGVAIWDRVEAVGGHVHCARERLDTSTPNGRFVRDIHLANAVKEREEHADRFEERRRLATIAGIWQRRQTPTGYRRDPVTRRLVPDERALEVRRAFRDRAAGVPVVEVARRLGMTPSGVRQLVRNRVYLGELQVGAHVNPAAHPAIVSVDEFYAAQTRVVTRPPRSGELEPALLGGLVRCGGCGHVMSRTPQTRAVVYSCHRDHSAGACPAPAAITMHRLDEYVTRVAVAQLKWLASTTVGVGEELDDARGVLTAAEGELSEFLAGVKAAGLGAESFAAAARARQDAVDEARRLVGKLASQATAPVTGDPGDVWDALSVGQRNRLLRGLVECVLVERAGRGRVMPVEARARVIAHGTGLIAPRAGGGAAEPIRRIALPDLDDPAVLRVDLAE